MPKTKKEDENPQQSQPEDENNKNEVLDPQEKLKKELDEKNDQLLRLAAEYDNFRKRSKREKEAVYSDVKTNVLGDLLPVIDNFERAIDGAGDDMENFKKGVEMIKNQLSDVFEKHGVESFGEPGESFDPNYHNAVMHIEDENYGENVIVDVFSKGYKIGQKVIRPATVRVAN